MSHTVRIIYSEYVDCNGKITIGGIQSYITNLLHVCNELGIPAKVYQFANKNNEYMIGKTEIISVKGASRAKDLIAYIEKDNPDYYDDILIFATDFMIVPSKFKRIIAIQHGVAWDITTDEIVSDLSNYISIFKNVFRTAKKYNRYKYCTDLVCVDYNFINWYRTQVAHVDANIHIIPNFAKISEFIPRNNSNSKSISVVFARRLIDYRGTKLFAEAIRKVIQIYPNITVTIAGAGPDKNWMKSYLSECKNVNFTTFKSEESLEFHSQYDIAVVPTKGSEGTSLSLLEAMSAGCAVIATNVGGMTNIIINGYNGLLISPNVNELINAIKYLIEDNVKRNQLAQKGYETVLNAFSDKKWKEKWKEVICENEDVLRKG